MALGFLARFVFSGIGLGLQSRFFQQALLQVKFWRFQFRWFCVQQNIAVQNWVSCKIKSSFLWFWFSIGGSGSNQFLPTKRAADGGESAQLISSFLASSFFYTSSLFLTHPRPPLTQTVSPPIKHH